MAMLDEEKIALRVGRTPLRRMGRVDDIAEAALYLASDRSSFVSGSVMLVDGGITHAFS
jgi:NAD(P)-dependent dehydrogenase (short-subunit alcohol dehydrogenase family)